MKLCFSCSFKFAWREGAAARFLCGLAVASSALNAGAQSVSASPGAADALTFNTSRTATFRDFANWTPSTSKSKAHDSVLRQGFALPAFLPPPPVANTADNVTGTAANTALDASGSYSGGLPGTTNDVVFTAGTAYAGSFTLNTSNLSIGTLNDLNATPLTITGTKSITLNGGTNSVSGTAGDLLYVAGTSNLTLNAPVILAASNNFDVAGTASIGGVISGGFGFNKTGTGTLTLSGANTYTGGANGTKVNAGTLKLGSTSALGTSTIAALIGTLDFNGFAITNAIADKAMNGGTLTNTGAAVDETGIGNIGASTGRSFNVDGTGNITFGQQFTGSNGAYTMTKNGTNTVTFSGTTPNTLGAIVTNGTLLLAKTNANAIHGTFTINGGTARLGGSGGDQIFNSSAVTVTSGTFDMNGNNETAGTLTIGDGTNTGIVQGTGSTYVVNTGGTIAAQSGSVSVALAGGGVALNKTTSGTVTLSGTNTYTGGTTVSSGTLAVNNASGSGTGTGAVNIASGATLTGTGTASGTVTDSGTINAGTVGSIGTLNTGALTFNNGSTLGFDLNASIADLLNSTGALSASPGVSVVGNALTALGASSYTLATFAGGLGSTPLSDFTLSGISGYTLAYNGNSLVLNQLPTTTATTYTLAAAAAASNLRVGATTGVTSTITNTGTGTADTLNYTGLGATPTTGATTSGGPLAQGASGTNNGLTFTASTVGANTITPTVGTANNATLGGNATLSGTTTASVNVYSGQETYTGASGGNYINGTNATVQSQWNQGGAPGLDAGFTGQDTATINGGKSVVLNASPNLAALTLGGGSSLTAGGGTLTLDGTHASVSGGTNGTAVVTATGAGNAIGAPTVLATATTLSTASSGDTLTVSGNVSGTGSLSKTGAGTVTLSGTDSATGTTTVSAGTLALANTGGAAITSSSITVNSSGTVAVQASNQLGTAPGTSNSLPSVTLNGGTLADANGSSLGTSSGESPTGQAGVTATSFGGGVLNLAAGTNSYLDFGMGTTPEVLAFSGVSGTGNLYILNYKDGNFKGGYTPASGGGIDQLFFGGSGQTAQELMNVFFVNPTGYNGQMYTQSYEARLLSTGEVVAPEPSQWVSLLVGSLMLGTLGVRARRKSQ